MFPKNKMLMRCLFVLAIFFALFFALAFGLEQIVSIKSSISQLQSQDWGWVWILSFLMVATAGCWVGVRYIQSKSLWLPIGRLFQPRKKPRDIKKTIEKVEHHLRTNFTELDDSLDVPVLGAPKVGRSTIIRRLLEQGGIGNGSMKVGLKLCEPPSLSAVINDNQSILEKHSTVRLAIVVVSNDLTDYEFEAVSYLTEHNVYVLVVLNKADVLSLREKGEIKEAILKKLEPLSKRCELLLIAADPISTIKILQSPDGSETEREVQREPDMKALLQSIKHNISVRAEEECVINFLNNDIEEVFDGS